MKKFVLIVVAAFAFINLGNIYDFFDPPPNFSSIAEGTVVIYTTSSCGYCFKAKRLFKNMSVKYVEFDIEKSKKAYQQFTQLGGQGVPLIVIGDKKIHGYSRDTIIETLKKI